MFAYSVCVYTLAKTMPRSDGSSTSSLQLYHHFPRFALLVGHHQHFESFGLDKFADLLVYAPEVIGVLLCFTDQPLKGFGILYRFELERCMVVPTQMHHVDD